MPRRLQRVLDVLIPLLVGAFCVLLALGPPYEAPPLPLLGALAGAGQGAALAWRRARPIGVLLVTLAGGVITWLYADDVIFPVAALFALFSVAALTTPPVSLLALAAVLGVTALSFFTAPDGDVGFALAVAVVVWALGEVARNRRVAIAEATRRAVGEEQARIARELHDVIAHSVSVIVVQAAAADDVFDARPDQARAALRSIEAAGREALAELRRLLAAVHQGAGGEPDGPQPGLDRLAELAAPLRAAGLQVDLRREAAGPLATGVDLSAYRIVQEALTNTLRHAGATRAEVVVQESSGVLELDVRDDGGGGGAEGGGGRGIAGMRERAALLGGTLEAGPLPGGGFRVHARLPLEPAG